MARSANRQGKIIAVANMKGGVGKTTTVVSLADAMAADDLDASVLVVDLDPHASASVCVAGDNLLYELIKQGNTFEDFIEKKLITHDISDLRSLIRDKISTVQHRGRTLDMSLLPCGPNLRLVEREIIFELARQRLGMNAIEGKIWQIFEQDFGNLRKVYDYIFFDCAPGISPISEAAIRVADLVIVPTIPDFISVYGLNAFHGSIWKAPSSLPKPKSAPHILITRLQRTKQHGDNCDSLRKGASRPGTQYKLFDATIPQAAGLADAIMKAGTITYTRKYSASLIDDTLTPLVDEVKEFLA